MQNKSKSMESTATVASRIEATLLTNEYYCLDKENCLTTYVATEPGVKINQSIFVRDGMKWHNCKVISFSKKTNLIEIKINKKPAMCFKAWKDGVFFVVKKPSKK